MTSRSSSSVSSRYQSATIELYWADQGGSMPRMSRALASFLICFAVAACGDDAVTQHPDAGPGADGGAGVDADTTQDPAALVRVTMDSQVGVLLDDFPAGSRDRIAAELMELPDQFWIDLARWQLR